MTIDRTKAALNGITPAQISEVLQVALSGRDRVGYFFDCWGNRFTIIIAIGCTDSLLQGLAQTL
ncbi:MAG: hypothetical protein LH613_04545 [Chamaesiphon sp.]|nr:hypothetical protein [Chamaesiphon sp.]